MASVSETIEIRLGADVYRVPRLTIGQWRALWARLAAFEQDGSPSAAEQFEANFQIAKIVLARATPKVEDFDALECAPTELIAARDAVFAFSGFVEGKAATDGG